MQWPEVRGQKDKQGSTKHYTEKSNNNNNNNNNLNNNNMIIIIECTSVHPMDNSCEVSLQSDTIQYNTISFI